MLLQQMLDVIRDPDLNFKQHAIDSLLYFLVPTLLATLISIPLGVLGSRSKLVSFVATNVTGLARAIPTLAFLAAVIPYLGQGFAPNVVALTLLGIPPILLNTVAGLRGIDPAAIDAARGMGMTSSQVFQRIQIPLALPVIAAGVRTAAVQIVATIPIAAFIGGGGWGDYIELGLGDPNSRAALYVGAILIGLLALTAESGLALAQRALTPAGLRVREGAEQTARVAPTEREVVAG